MTLAVNQLEKELTERFPELRYGRCNCRPIAGSSTWSQHSWPGAEGKPCGNGRDLYAPVGHPDPMLYLDGVHAFIKTYFHELSVRTLLWRVRDHFSHIHVDHWAKGYGTPPCAGGRLVYQFSSGDFAYADPGPENGIHDLPDKEGWTPEEEQMLTQGDDGLAVADYQAALIASGQNLGPWDPYGPGYPEGADGKYGQATTDATKAYQSERGLKVTGHGDGLTVAFLFDDTGTAGGGTLTHTHDFKVTIPGQTINATTGIGEA